MSLWLQQLGAEGGGDGGGGATAAAAAAAAAVAAIVPADVAAAAAAAGNLVQVGEVKKLAPSSLADIAKEIATDADKFTISFPQDLKVTDIFSDSLIWLRMYIPGTRSAQYVL